MAGKEFCIFGRRPVFEALKAGRRFDKILLLKNAISDDIKEIMQLAGQTDTPIQKVPREKLDSVAKKYARYREANHQGIIGFLSIIDYHSLDDVLHHVYANGETPLLLVLDGVTDVGNFGAIVRSAECFGAHAVIVPTQGSAQISGETMKASAGALNNIFVCREKSLPIALKFLRSNGIRIFAAVADSEADISKADFTVPCAIILGSEGGGISAEIMKLCDEKIAIPLKGEIQSLNVSVAAGIILYQANKTRDGIV